MRQRPRRCLMILFGLGTAAPFLALAHGEGVAAAPMEQLFRVTTWWVVGVAGVFMALVTVLILARKPRKARYKWLFFLLLAVPTVLTTLYLAFSTALLNVLSETGGPVHWHAEFQVVVCGEKNDLKNPSGMTNRVGTPLLHEHGDNWIHVEGVPVEVENVSLHHFFEDVGGKLTKTEMLYPTVNGPVYVQNGDTCPDGSEGELQVFVYQAHDGVATQQKLEDFPNYVLSPESQVPPGDCVVVEFGPPKERTNRICEQYDVAEQEGEIEIQN